MNMEPPLEASPKEKFDTLFGLLKDHYAGLFDFEFKNVTVLTLLLGWTLASNDARSFLHTHRGIAYCACVVVLLYAALLLNFDPYGENTFLFRHPQDFVT